MSTDFSLDRMRRALEVFEAAIEQERHVRPAFVRTACGEDRELLGEVEALLEKEDGAAAFFDSSAIAAEALAAAGSADTVRGPALSPGERFGNFRIESRIGAGGMGEVYRAVDSRLGRAVAIKILRAPFARRRHLTEAQAISALNHPAICTLHDIGRHDGVDYLVMEYLKGETLADRLARSALPLAQVIDLADQIAGALAAAHSRGILHRDLKPGNIMLTDAGAKVLDFGLAKVSAWTASGDVDAVTPGASSETREGTVLGTAAYMSPEQARGEAVDQQTDIWSFGCVLYEMLTRRQAFGGRTQSDRIAACLEREPAWSALPSSIPTSLRVLLERCLRKDRDYRLHDIADARLELEEARHGGRADGSHRGPPPPGTVARRRVAVLLALTAVFAALATLGLVRLGPAPPPAVSPRRALSINLPDTAPLIPEHSLLMSIGRPSIALSPDGGRLAYVAPHGDTSLLYVRTLDDFEVEPISGTEGAFAPFFSPDGEWLGFFTRDRLHKVSLRGGRPLPLCEATNPDSGTWGSTNTIAFASRFGRALHVVPANGGPVEEVTRPDSFSGADIRQFHGPRFLPDGGAVLVSTGYLENHLEVIVVPGGEVLAVIEERGHYPTYSPSGHILFGRFGDLYAVPFDLERLEVTGSVVPVVAGVRTAESWNGGAHQSALAAEGTMAFVPGPRLDKGVLVWSDHSGGTSPAFAEERVYGSFQISPDGGKLAVTVLDVSLHVWIYHFDGSRPPLRLTSEGQNYAPVWHAGGARVAFTSFLDDRFALLSKPADGTGEAESLLSDDWGGGLLNKPRVVSHDGTKLLFDASRPSGLDIWVYHFDERRAEPLVEGPWGEAAPAFSPDGASLAYTSDRTGGYEVFVRPYHGGSPDLQVSANGGEEPIWSPDGDVIFYRNGEKWMKGFPDGRTPELLFRGPYINVPGISYDYDVRRKRFLLLRRVAAESSPREVRVILNGFETLERLAPSPRH